MPLHQQIVLVKQISIRNLGEKNLKSVNVQVLEEEGNPLSLLGT